MIDKRFSNRSFSTSVDWGLIIAYLLLVLIGWMNIYASIHTDEQTAVFDFANRSGKQFVWIMTALGIGAIILFLIPHSAYEGLSIPLYLFIMALLVGVIFLGVERNGSRSWFELGPVSLQPAELSKIATSLLLASVMSQSNYKLNRTKDFVLTAAIIAVPMLTILCQNETGSALVYVGFIFMLYREGLSGWLLFMMFMAILLFIVTLVASPYWAIMLLGFVVALCDCISSRKMKQWWSIFMPVMLVLVILPFVKMDFAEKNPLSFMASFNPLWILLPLCMALIPILLVQGYKEKNGFKMVSAIAFIAGIILIFSGDIIFNEVLQDHQRKRIEVLLGMKEDPMGVGYNVRQSMIAIGSGGLFGKGFLKGTQTKFGFVPEQSTDFIFCTVGEEWGFIGSCAVILLYVFLIWRIIRGAERSREAFTRIYGYCVACCIFMHLFINIGMTIGLMPVIGIPLPLLSYGGSSLWTFTAMIFIFIALDRNEKKYF